MAAIQLLFSPEGRMARLNYLLLSGVFGMLNWGLMVLLAFNAELELKTILTGGLFSMLSASPGLGAAIVTIMWVQLCLVFKRSRDFSGTATFGTAFAILWFGPMIVMMAGGAQSLAAGGMLQLISAIPLIIMGLFLMFKGSKEPDTDLDLVFGSAHSKNANELGQITEDTDLVARAAALRNIAEADIKPVAPVEKKPAVQRQSGFGKRRVAPVR